MRLPGWLLTGITLAALIAPSSATGDTPATIAKLNSALTELAKVQPKNKASNIALAAGKQDVRDARAELEATTFPPPDTTPPNTTITSQPPASTESTSASFSFSSTEPGTFACSLDTSVYAPCTSPKVYAVAVGNHTFSVRATDAAGNVDPTPATAAWTVTSPPVEEPPVEEPPTQTIHCFSAPAACGFPAPGNTGVPSGTTLTASGSITASTAGQVVSGKDVTGTITVAANNVTVQNSRVTQTGNCGATSTCGNSAIKINSGITGTIIKNTETATVAGDTCEHDIRNQGGETNLGEGLYLHACDSNWYGGGTLKNSYGVTKKVIREDHVENVYFCSGTFTADHDTLLSPVVQTAVVFGDTICGGGNHFTVKNSLVAGGGYTFYPQANNTNPSGAVTTITGNHFARCLGSQVESGGHHYCSGHTPNSAEEVTPTADGYFPNVGSYDLCTSPGTACSTATWSGNVYDDNGATVPRP